MSKKDRSGERGRAGLALVVCLLSAACGPLLWAPASDAGAPREPPAWSSASSGFPTSSNFYGVSFGDFNNDGNLDVVGAGESSGLRVFLGDGNGNWSAVASHPATSGGFNDVRVGDMDGDGNQDIVAGTTGIKLYKSDGAGGFTDISSTSGLPTSSNWRGIALGDVNGDGRLDIAATNGYGSSLGIRVYTGDGTGRFQGISSGLPQNQDRDSAIVLADFNGDGSLDLAAGGAAGASCYLGNGGAGGAMSWSSSSSGLPSDRFSGVNATDFDSDGDPDILVGSYSGRGLRVYRNLREAPPVPGLSLLSPLGGAS